MYDTKLLENNCGWKGGAIEANISLLYCALLFSFTVDIFLFTLLYFISRISVILAPTYTLNVSSDGEHRFNRLA